MKKPLPTIGVYKYTFFAVTEDENGTITYGNPYELKGVVEVTPTDAGGSDVFDADNGAYDVYTYIEKIGHEIVNADIPSEVELMWRGLKRKYSVVDVGTNMSPVYFGVTWRVLKSDGTYRYVRYYKGSYSFPSNVGGKTKPSSGAPNRQTAKATFTAVQRPSDGLYYSFVDEGDFSMDREVFERNWFSNMTYYPGDEISSGSWEA